MSDQRFLSLVKRQGGFLSTGEASRAAHAVFGTIKSWISPAAAGEIRELLPQDAARLWQYSPVSLWSDLGPFWKDMEFARLILKVQQLGRYTSSTEAQRAYAAVVEALHTLIPVGAEMEMIVGKPLPAVSAGACEPRLKAVV